MAKTDKAKYYKAVKKAIYKRFGRRMGPLEYWLFRRTTNYRHMHGETPRRVAEMAGCFVPYQKKSGRFIAIQS